MTTIRTSALAALGACMLAGCAGAMREADSPSDSRACAVPMTASSPEAQAVACAEEFIARNGYTDAEPAAAHRLASESLEPTGAAQAVARRRGTLERRARAVCRGAGFTVVFRSLTYSADGRAVTMTRRFNQMRMEHRSVILRNVERRVDCELRS